VTEALEWHEVLVSTSKLFPISLASFLLTGAYMVSVLGTRAWSSGFTIAGLVGVTLLLGSAPYPGVKAKELRQLLQNVASKDANAAPPRLVPQRLATMLPVINTGIAIALVYDMTVKPASIALALAVIA
jgi:hypothetical protein